MLIMLSICLWQCHLSEIYIKQRVKIPKSDQTKLSLRFLRINCIFLKYVFIYIQVLFKPDKL